MEDAARASTPLGPCVRERVRDPWLPHGHSQVCWEAVLIRNLALATACAGVALAPLCVPAANAYESGLNPVFVIKDSRVDTSSGLVASTRSNGLYFTHNDGGDSNRLFAVD